MEIVDLGPIFSAAYRGECRCGEPFDEDDELHYSDGEIVAQQCCGQDIEDANKEAMGAWG